MMKRKMIQLLSVILILCFSLCGTAFASSDHIWDHAGLFTDEEIDHIEATIQELQEKTDMDYLIVTTDDAEGKSAAEYAGDAYEASGLGTGDNYSGLTYLIDMDNREIYLATEGDMIRYLTDDRIDSILNRAFEDVADGYYADSVFAVLQHTEDYIAHGVLEDQYNYDSETGEYDYYEEETGFPVIALVFGLIAGAIAAGCTFLGVKGKYQLVFETYHYPLSEKSKLNLTVNEDRLVNTFVTHRRIPKNPPPSSGGRSSGARSTTHRSSSGRVRGGGGRKF